MKNINFHKNFTIAAVAILIGHAGANVGEVLLMWGFVIVMAIGLSLLDYFVDRREARR